MPNNQKELLPIVVQENNVLIDAELLHQQLQSSGRFRDWITYRIKEYNFEEGKDFFTAKKVRSNQKGQPQIQYLITLDMAKELAMLERNDVGRHVRRYFIEKEKELRAISHLPPQAELFKGLLPNAINGHELYHYKTILERSGYSTRTGGSRRARYPQPFVLVGKELYITQAFALHLHHQKQVYNNRTALKAMPPVLPADFGEPLPAKALKKA